MVVFANYRRYALVMNYDTFEREVLGYAWQMQLRTERARGRRGDASMSAPAPRRSAPRSRVVRFHVALALRNFADRLEASAAHPV
ncbi:MAG: hypothetical protein NVSMB17_07170 [Candidatus Dormibacteria bacterium]